MEKLIYGIHHIALKCRDYDQFEKTVKFYRDTLGIELVRSWGKGDSAGIMLDTGCGIIEIFASGAESSGTGAINHMAFCTKDTDGCIRAVNEAGYKITIEPSDIIIESKPPYPARIGFCTGPVGETIEFFCVK